jgi:hypothetical protein
MGAVVVDVNCQCVYTSIQSKSVRDAKSSDGSVEIIATSKAPRSTCDASGIHLMV